MAQVSAPPYAVQQQVMLEGDFGQSHLSNMLQFPPAGQLMPKYHLSALNHKDQEGKFTLMFLS